MQNSLRQSVYIYSSYLINVTKAHYNYKDTYVAVLKYVIVALNTHIGFTAKNNRLCHSNKKHPIIYLDASSIWRTTTRVDGFLFDNEKLNVWRVRSRTQTYRVSNKHIKGLINNSAASKCGIYVMTRRSRRRRIKRILRWDVWKAKERKCLNKILRFQHKRTESLGIVGRHWQ